MTRVRVATLAPLLLASALCLPTAGEAQRLPARFQATRPAARDSVRVFPHSYWVEGATIGAAVVGSTAVFFAAGLCGLDEGGDPCRPAVYVASAAVGGVVGVGLGALLGGVFPAPRARPLRGSPGQAALIGAGGGALWSVGFLCHAVRDGCGHGEALFGLSVSLAGALAGWLIGH